MTTMTSLPTRNGARILSVGAARGDLDVPNDDLVGPIDSSDEWIRQRTGIITRTRASHDQMAVDLATEAGKEAIQHRFDADMPDWPSRPRSGKWA